MVRVSSPAKLRPWSELTAKMVMGVVPGLVTAQCGEAQIMALENSLKDGLGAHGTLPSSGAGQERLREKP